MADKLNVSGKGAIITGAGSGINLAFAKELYQANCSVLIVDIALHHTATEWLNTLPKNAGPKVAFYKADVSDWTELERSYDVYDKEIGGVPYIVCPGAGIYEPSHNGFWTDTDVDGHYRLFDINLLSPIKMTRLAIKKMLGVNQPGIVVHVSSTGAQKASIITPLYQSGKSAISAFVRCMGQLHGFCGIRVVGVAPGIIKSPLFTDHPEIMRYIDSTKDNMLEPEAVARAMFAVATDPKYPPGTILECADLDDNWRVVNLLNDPGPQGRASWSSNKDLALEDVKKMIDADRGTK
ncbi:NAD(P)-binding domain protein [Niveomyces insectorum RCEF 264]|uniref:NAD(P)-binding domain protein n=1 Tax=Niveomyces insectorum RCEF 264 TaxID=1081102 RepID=A0A167T4A2_9HYPO|nr:NAD(P)-binding domain protein [Niveomyces insectorum RCEF 264]